MLDDRLTSTISALRRKYLASLPERQRQIAAQVLDLCDNGFSEEGRSNLFYLVHNIVGVAPTYGLPHLGQLATNVEVLLAEAKGKDSLSEIDEDELIVAMELLIMEMGQATETE